MVGNAIGRSANSRADLVSTMLETSVLIGAPSKTFSLRDEDCINRGVRTQRSLAWRDRRAETNEVGVSLDKRRCSRHLTTRNAKA